MIVLVSGSREGFTYQEFCDIFEDKYKDVKVTELIAGGARGIDRYAKMYAKEKNLEFTEMLADWDGQGKRAGSIRNTDMAVHLMELRDAGYKVSVIALRYDSSSGTTDMIKKAMKFKFDVFVFDKKLFDFS